MNKCSDTSLCSNIAGSYQCKCPIGNYLQNDKRTCTSKCVYLYNIHVQVLLASGDSRFNMGYIVKNWKIKFICVFWYDGDNYRIFENVLNIYHITLFHVLNLKTQACTSCLFPNYTIINIINFYRQKMCVYCTRTVRKVRGQVPICVCTVCFLSVIIKHISYFAYINIVLCIHDFNLF